jgi:hypothetical protein
MMAVLLISKTVEPVCGIRVRRYDQRDKESHRLTQIDHHKHHHKHEAIMCQISSASGRRIRGTAMRDTWLVLVSYLLG